MRRVAKLIASSLLFSTALVCAPTIWAQQQQLTAQDYANAERFMSYNVLPLVYHGVSEPVWWPDGRFWYRDRGANGFTYMVVDPTRKTVAPAFDQVKLAAALQRLMGRGAAVSAMRLPSVGFQDFTLANGGQTVLFELGDGHVRCDLSGPGVCTVAPEAKHGREPVDVSPDGSRAAFIRDWNLWVRDTATGAETQLTTDGAKDYGYATDNAGWTHSDKPIVLWSPDSKKIATFQQDQRRDGEMYLVPVTHGHPKLEAWKYPLPGDKDVTMIERVVVDVDARSVVRFKMPPDEHRSSLCDDVSCKGGSGWDDVEWSADSKTIGFVSTSRDHKQEWMRVADAATGDVREVMSETVKTYFESGNDHVNWRYLPETKELIWFSERDNWGQLYLYDLATGKLKQQITTGEGNVTQLLRVDEKARVLYFLAVGKQHGVDPYYAQFYRINMDGKNLKLLTPEAADHAVTLSQDGKWFVDVYSTPQIPQVTVVRDETGAVAVQVAKQDIGALTAEGWRPPVSFTVKARDGKTDLYGMMLRPTKFDAAKKYPIVNYIYPGPQTGSCGSRSFNAVRSDWQPLAELGFVVVCIDGMGTPWRSKAFHDAYFGDMGDNTLPDQVAGMKALGARYPWIDLTRVGIYGHSGGGYATVGAMLHYPEFFKVGIAESGNHDNREYEDDWAEKWIGLLKVNPDGTSNYDSQANENFAANLKGKLLLAHGTMDDNVPENNTLLMVDALIKANKDFDLLMIPNAHHGYGEAAQYVARRRWDYFVRNLAGNVPPVEYQMKPYAQVRAVLVDGPDSEDAEF